MMLLLFLCVYWASGKVCQGINGQMNTFFKTHDTQRLWDIGSHDGIETYNIDRWADMTKKWHVHKAGSSLVHTKMVFKKMEVIIHDEILTDDKIKEYSNATDDVFLLAMSNLRYMNIKPYGWTGNSLARGAGIITFTERLLIDAKKGLHLDQPRFFVFIQEEDDDFSLSQGLPVGSRKEVYRYAYPREIPFNVYDSDGKFIRAELKGPESTGTLVRDETMAVRQVGTYNMVSTGVNSVEFIAFVYAGQSLKLIKYDWRVYGGDATPHIQWARNVVPKVEKDGFDPDNYYSAFMTVSETVDEVYVVAAVRTEQLGAIKTVYPEAASKIDFMGKEGPYPLLFVFKKTDGTIKYIINLMDGPSTGWPGRAFPTAITERKGQVIVSGNTYLFDSPDDRKSDGAAPWYSHIDFSKAAPVLKSNLDFASKLKKYRKIRGRGKYESSMIFNAYAVSWPVDGLTERFVIGGCFYTPKDNYNFKGRSYLVEPESGDVKWETNVGLSDVKSNNLNQVSIWEYKPGKYRMFLNIGSDLPTQPPSKKKQRFKDADIWVVDCTKPNAALELAAKIIFFCFVGISFIMFTFAVIVFTIKAVVNCIKKRKAKNKDFL